MRVDRLDHLVLTVADLAATEAFYVEVLGMTATTFGGGRHALTYGRAKINLHEAGHEFEPKAENPTPGSTDLCFAVDDDIDAVVEHLSALGVAIEEGPVDRTGALGPMRSVYVRDPDWNLTELAHYPA